MAHLFSVNALWILGLMTGLWLYSVWCKDASIVDPWWSIGFWMVYTRTALDSGLTLGKGVLWGAVTLWAWRLALHLWSRARGKPEDPRYQAFRQRFGAERYWWVSFFQVFLLQGTLMWVISLPLQLAAAAGPPDGLAWNDWVGLGFFVVGFGFEAVADWQLTRFRNDAAMKGRVLNTGLWRYSRHPNYFGETVLWWGFWLCVLDAPWGPATVFAPALMTFLLLRVSGVTLLEGQLKRTRRGYEDYIQSTSAFLPRPPRQDRLTS
jgi:steroid 5-alpha reductase family enzyme